MHFLKISLKLHLWLPLWESRKPYLDNVIIYNSAFVVRFSQELLLYSSSWVFCPRACLSLQAQEPRLQFCRRQGFLGKLKEQGCSFYHSLNRCGSFPLLSAHHSLFSIWTDLKSSEKIPGARTWGWGEWIWLTGPSGLHTEILHRGEISVPSGFLTRSEIQKSKSTFTPSKPYKA